MELQGVHYDTGTVFRGRGYAISSRRHPLNMAVVRRELQIIRDDLHANAVRVTGSDDPDMTWDPRSRSLRSRPPLRRTRAGFGPGRRADP